mgnify:CR=1 FL=1
MPFPRRSFLAATGTALAATASQASRAHAATAAEAGGVGRRLAAELTVRKDPVSGATIRQLTDWDPKKVGSVRHSFVTNPIRDEVI